MEMFGLYFGIIDWIIIGILALFLIVGLSKGSMGMSNDYKLALKYGATTLRLGRIFLEGAK